MTILLASLFFMALCAAAFLAAPFVGRVGDAPPPRASADALRDELAAIEAACARGDMDAEGAGAARTDAERRFLRDDPGAPGDAMTPAGTNAPMDVNAPAGANAVTGAEADADGHPGAATGTSATPRAGVRREPADRRAAALVAATIILAAGGLYAAIGRPDLVTPAVAPAQSAEAQLDQLTHRLEQRLAKAPDDAEGWRALGWAYFIAGRYDVSAQAYTRAIALKPDDAAVRSAYGEALVGLGKGVVTEDASLAFTAALARNSGDIRARFYLGLAKAQGGDPKAAIKDWLALYHEAPAGSDAAGELRQRITELAAQSKIDVSGDFPPAGPNAQDLQNAAQMSDQERAAMIDAMVTTLDKRLTAHPDDLQGWLRLIHARAVQGKPDLAGDALRRARAAFAGNAEAQTALTQAAAESGLR